MSLGIFVEGQSDRTTIPILIRKAGYAGGIQTRIVHRGDMLDIAEVSRHVDALLSLHRDVDKILVFIDWEGVDPARTQRDTRGAASRLNRIAGGVPLRYIVVDHSLEGWLACDTDALKAVLGRDAKIHTGGNPENHLRPAETMSRIFRDNGRDFSKTRHNPRIAEAVTVERIADKSPTFRRLLRTLRASAS